MKRKPLAAWAVLAVTVPLFAPSGVRAQAGPFPVVPGGAVRPSAPLTLADALATAKPPQHDVYLSVGADTVRRPPPTPDGPPPADPPAPGAAVEEVADAYGRLIFTFGSVTALAPPTMTVLNTDPGTPSPFADLPKSDACRLLLGGLNTAQWAALTSRQGLGLADLSDPAQRALFAALFPAHGATLHPTHGWDEGPTQDAPVQLTEADMAGVRLRLGQRVMIGLPIVGKPNTWLDSPGQVQYQMYNQIELGRDTMYGIQVRDAVPNVLKNGDLDFALPALKQAVSLTGTPTVGDLVARVGQTLGLELYADRRYEKRRVTVLGPPSAPAKDVLRALALCVAGAYRRVGPAFVLTDDVVGVGTRRLILHRFAQQADLMRHGVVSEAGDRLLTAHGGVDALPMAATLLGLSDAQKAQSAQGMPSMPGRGASLQIPLAQLTPAQQQAARAYTDQWNDRQAAQAGHGNIDGDRLTLDGKILLQTQPTVEMVTPVVPGPVDLSDYLNAWNLFQPSPKLQQSFWKQQQEARKKTPPPVTAPVAAPPPPPSLSAVLPAVPRRAVIARPRTTAEVDALVASLQAAGLNQLWLDVFSEGRSRLDPPADAKTADTKPTGPDILAEALARTKGTGITVIPALDLLDWDKAAPADAVDRTILGETSAEAATHRRHYEEVMYSGLSEDEAARQPAVTALSVSPASDVVRQTLLALVARLAGTPGVTALALRGTVTPGYDRAADSHYGVQGDPLGYTLPLRLAFLRRQHIDPVDLEPETYDGQVTADLSLPGFDDYGAMGDSAAQWNALRSSADTDLMAQLLAAARASGPAGLSFWVKTRRSSYLADWYGLWGDPRGPLPALSEEKAFGGSDPNTDYAALARAQCRTDVFVLDGWAAQSAVSLAVAVKGLKPGWDGFVLDLTERGGDPLAPLVKSLSPPAPAVSK